MTPAELVEKYSSFRLDMPKNKQKELIKKAAVEERTNFFKIRPSRKYINLYAELLKAFTNSRGKGRRVDFNWLWLEAWNVYQVQEGQDAVVKKHVMTNFIETPLKVPQSTAKEKEV